MGGKLRNIPYPSKATFPLLLPTDFERPYQFFAIFAHLPLQIPDGSHAHSYQRHRVEWVIEEARSMETDMSQQRKKAESNTKGNTRESKKRRRDEEEEISLESQSKRAKGRAGSENVASGATRDRPYTQSVRRSARHTSLKTGV